MTILRNIEYDMMNDVLFKYVFGANERKHITIGFLNAVLNREGANAIKDIEFHNVEFVPQREEERSARIDIFAIIDDKESVDIEVQCMNYQNMEKRSLFYWAHMFLHSKNSLKRARPFIDIKPAIAINILAYSFLPGENPLSKYTLHNEESMHKLTDVIQLYFLEVPKLIKHPAKDMNFLERWLGFLSKKFTKEEKEAIAMEEPLIKDAMDAVELFMSDETSYRQYLARQSAIWDYNSDMTAYREKGRVEGIKKGRAEGIKKGRAEGREEGENKLLRLIDALYNVGRQDDIAKLYADKNLREKLYKEFNID